VVNGAVSPRSAARAARKTTGDERETSGIEEAMRLVILLECAAILAIAVSPACRSARHDTVYATGAAAEPMIPSAEPPPPLRETAEVAVPAPQAPGEPTKAQGDQEFPSAESALLAVAAAGEAGDHDRIAAIFGHGCEDLVASEDDDPEAGDDCARVATMIRERLEFEDGPGGRRFAVIGNDRWRFPIPVAKSGGGWTFDVEAGREQIRTIEIGRNELSTVEALEELMEAQREYAAESRDGQPRAFAAKFASGDGRHDGLHWKGGPESRPSPIGPDLAAAADDGGGAVPFHGYYYKPLTGQGKSAPGGEYSYRDADGRQTGGCGALAWPAEYGASGVMTFVVNHAGIVFEKDLGADTAAKVKAITTFDPDATWAPVKR
jgi:hypothetical protein